MTWDVWPAGDRNYGEPQMIALKLPKDTLRCLLRAVEATERQRDELIGILLRYSLAHWPAIR